jgi:SAM-dependent methyltransferase
MDAQLYLQMAEFEQTHWWFVGRRVIIESFIKRLQLPKDIKILEAGCGTGGNLLMLSKYGEVSAFELNEEAQVLAQRYQIANVKSGVLPDQIPFSEQQFDIIILLDVLEHLEHDLAGLQALYKRLKTGGYLILTVPALPILWSEHDVQHHHFRRYTKKQLIEQAKKAGFEIKRASYFNFFLFPAILAVRLLQKLFKKKAQNDLSLSPIWINNLLVKLFGSESFLLKHISLPIGVSLVLTVMRNN